MFSQNRICRLFNIKYPVVQAGMVWCSGWELASAVSNAGGLGLLGAGSMTPEILDVHLKKTHAATRQPFGVNLPLLSADTEKKISIIARHNVKIVFTSAGNPKQWTGRLKDLGCTVVHVVSSAKFAEKAEQAGVDALVAEGFEAGGHNGREETTSFVLIPAVAKQSQLPLLAAGGMYGGRSLLAARALGADGIQIGTRFAICKESSAHERFKQKIREINEGETRLVLKKLTPVRLVKNEFYHNIVKAEEANATKEKLLSILGQGRSRRGIFDGDLSEGELEIGQVSALLEKKESVAEILDDILTEYDYWRKLITKDEF